MTNSSSTPLFDLLVATVPSVCGSRGPRIGEDSPRCAQELDHRGLHRGFDGSGFERETWGDPLSRDLEFARDWENFERAERRRLFTFA